MRNYWVQRIVNVLLRGLSMASRFALIFVLAKLFEPAEIGLFGLFIATVSFSALVIGGNFYSYSQRELISSKRADWSFVIQHQALATGVLYLLLVPPQLLLFKFELIPHHLIFWFFSLLITEHIAQELNRLLIAMQRQLIASAVLFLRVGVWVWVVLPYMWFTPEQRSVETVFLAWLVGNVLAVLVGLYIVWHETSPWRFWSVDYKWIKRGFAIGSMFLIATITFKALFTADRYTVEYLVGLELLGVYVLYSGMAMSAINFLDPAVFSFMYPRLVNAYRSGDIEGYDLAMKELLWSTVGVSLLFVTLVAMLAPFVLQWIGNSVYMEHLSVLWLLLAVAFVYAIGMIPHYGLYAKGNDRPMLIAHVSSLFIFAITIFATASFSPFEAVAYGLLSAFLWILIVKFYFYKKTNFSSR